MRIKSAQNWHISTSCMVKWLLLPPYWCFCTNDCLLSVRFIAQALKKSENGPYLRPVIVTHTYIHSAWDMQHLIKAHCSEFKPVSGLYSQLATGVEETCAYLFLHNVSSLVKPKRKGELPWRLKGSIGVYSIACCNSLLPGFPENFTSEHFCKLFWNNSVACRLKVGENMHCDLIFFQVTYFL